MTELERSWVLAKTPPYHVYLKALYELYHTDVGGGELTVPPRDQELANFQLDAVRRGLSMVEAYGGCYIGDVVGLGKTFVGAELLRQLRVSYPKRGATAHSLPGQTEAHVGGVQRAFRLGGGSRLSQHDRRPSRSRVRGGTGAVRGRGSSPGKASLLDQTYRNRGPVLVDEAHNFRNINQRSRGLTSYLESGDHKLILLSATPQNLGPMDIYRQLRLFLHDTEHGLNIEPVSLEGYFHNAQEWLAYRALYENYEAEFGAWQALGSAGAPPLPPDKPKVPKAEIDQVLLPVFIRRRRRDIRDLYGDTALVDGKPVRFPDPVLDNVEYRLDKVYAKAGPLSELEALLREHKAARYRATEYIRGRSQDEAGVPRPLPGGGQDSPADGRAAAEAAGVQH